MVIKKQHFEQAWMTLMAAKLRSGLAMLGILIATAAIVTLLNCSLFATEKALAQFKSLGTDLIALSLFQSNHGETVAEIPVSTWRQLPKMIPAVKQIAPYISVYQPISFEGHLLHGTIIGADEVLPRIIQLSMARGRFVSALESYERVCVIGDGLATALQHQHFVDPMGQKIRIGDGLYTIIGVAKPWSENGFFSINVNEAVIVPLAGVRLLNRDAKITALVLRVKAKTRGDLIMTQLQQWVHQQSPKSELFIRSAKQIIDSMQKQRRIFTVLLATIGGIALLVGGIGVMNVMLISVSERKQEIGIRKAIGATQRDIQHLFLIESTLLAVFGGIVGLILGVGLSFVIAFFSHWEFHFLFMPLLIGFMISAGSGIFFGFYPARRAAYLQPMDSLRAE